MTPAPESGWNSACSASGSCSPTGTGPCPRWWPPTGPIRRRIRIRPLDPHVVSLSPMHTGPTPRSGCALLLRARPHGRPPDAPPRRRRPVHVGARTPRPSHRHRRNRLLDDDGGKGRPACGASSPTRPPPSSVSPTSSPSTVTPPPLTQLTAVGVMRRAHPKSRPPQPLPVRSLITQGRRLPLVHGQTVSASAHSGML